MDAHASPPIVPLTSSGIPAEHVGYASGVASLNDVTHASEHDADAGACLTISTASSSAHVPNAPVQHVTAPAVVQTCSDTSAQHLSQSLAIPGPVFAELFAYNAHLSAAFADSATSSGLSIAHPSSVPQRASCSFDGIDPNGSDASLMLPAKQQRLR